MSVNPVPHLAVATSSARDVAGDVASNGAPNGAAKPAPNGALNAASLVAGDVADSAAEPLPWPPAGATAIGSMPGSDPVEAAKVVLGELPDFPYLPELPGRGVGADILGRGAALLVDLPVEVVPSGYRVAARPGMDSRRAVDLMQRDLDAVQDVLDQTRVRPAVLKVQLPGPWTLAAGIELPRGHRVLTDKGALREFTESLAEGLTTHVREVAARTGAAVIVQLDEPTLPAVLAGSLPTPSGLGTVAPVEEADVTQTLARVVDAATSATGQPVIVHCCAPRPPLSLLRAAGATGLAVDATLLARGGAELWDELGTVWDDGATMFLGLVPTTEPAQPVELRALAGPALRLVDRLGFNRAILAERAVATPSCGLAAARASWATRALKLSVDLGKAFVEPPESW